MGRMAGMLRCLCYLVECRMSHQELEDEDLVVGGTKHHI